jgi:hypothetical protein
MTNAAHAEAFRGASSTKGDRTPMRWRMKFGETWRCRLGQNALTINRQRGVFYL